MVLIPSGVTCWLVSFTVKGGLEVPTVTNLKFNDAGESFTGVIADPDNPTDCGPVCAVLVMVTAPLVVPVTTGANVISMVQLSPAFSTVQSEVSLYIPLGTIEVTVTLLLPELVSSTVCAALVV